MKHIQHKAKYNNYVSELIDCLEDHIADLGIFPRLLAMETDYKQWVEKQMADITPNHHPFITDDMLHLAEDPQVQVLMELHTEVMELISLLSAYWQQTDELKSEFN